MEDLLSNSFCGICYRQGRPGPPITNYHTIYEWAIMFYFIIVEACAAAVSCEGRDWLPTLPSRHLWQHWVFSHHVGSSANNGILLRLMLGKPNRSMLTYRRIFTHRPLCDFLKSLA